MNAEIIDLATSLEHFHFSQRQRAVLDHALALFAQGGDKTLSLNRLTSAARCSMQGSR